MENRSTLLDLFPIISYPFRLISKSVKNLEKQEAEEEVIIKINLLKDAPSKEIAN